MIRSSRYKDQTEAAKRGSLISNFFFDTINALVKRTFDFIAALIGLILLSPAFLLIAILIKRTSPGPVFYRGPRIGKDGKTFGILKFRTMYERPESYQGPPVTGEGDNRITPLGKWLRDTKVNELPQLWNVLVGEMSLVGPRPEDPKIARTWPMGAYQEILSVRPGMTSPASIAYHDEEKRLNSAGVVDEYITNIVPDKLRLDQLYVRHHNFITDLDALFWTFVILIPRLGDQRILEGWLFGGPVSRFVTRYVSWTIVDFLVALLAIGLLGVQWRISGPLNIGLVKAFYLAVGLALLFGLFNTLLGLKVVSWSRAAAEDVLLLFVSCGLVTLTLTMLEVTFELRYYLPIRFMFAAGPMVLFGFIAVRYRLRLVTGLASRWIRFRNSGYGAGERVLLIGAGAESEFATWLFRRTDFKKLYTPIGIVDDDPAKQGMRFDGIKVLGTTADIPELVKRYDIGVLFYTISRISPADSQRILATCKRTNVNLVMLDDVLRILHSRLTNTAPLCEKPCPYFIGANSQWQAVPSESGLEDLQR